MNKPIVYIDMDGVLVDLGSEINTWFMNHPNLTDKYGECPDHIPGIFRNPPPMEVIEAVTKLYNSDKYDLFITNFCSLGKS